MTQRDPDQTIRAWFEEGPSRGPERGLEATLARLAGEPVAPRREIRLPVWMPLAAAVALLLAGILAFGAGFRIVPPGPLATPSSALPSAWATACRLEVPVHGRDAVLTGVGFAPDADVVLRFDRADGSRLTLDHSTVASLHTDRSGGFFMPIRPYPEDLGRGRITATAGCTTSLDLEVTAADLPTPCPDAATPNEPIVDGPAYRAAVTADAPIAWWRLDDAGTAAADAAGDHPGTYVGNMEHAAGTPLSDGGSAYFHHQFPAPTDIELQPIVLSDDFSIEWWMLFCHWADGDAIVGSPDSIAGLRVGEGELNFNDGVREVAWAGAEVVPGAWQHLVFTRTGTRLDFYHNGLLQSSNDESGWTGDFTIAEIGIANGSDNYLGYLDEVALYDQALTPERIAAHARS